MPSAKRVDPKTGIPYGMSENAYKNQTYTQTSNGNYAYVGAKATPKVATARISATPGVDGRINPDTQRRIDEDIKKQLIYDKQAATQNNIRDASIGAANNNAANARARELGTPQSTDYYNSADYAKNVGQFYDIGAKFNTDRNALENQFAQDAQKRAEANQLQQMQKTDARQRIANADSPQANQNLVDDWARYYQRVGYSPEAALQAAQARVPDALTLNYLQSAGMVPLDANGQPNKNGVNGTTSLYGSGSSNFTPENGFTNTAKDISDYRAYTQSLRNDKVDPANAGIPTAQLRDKFLGSQLTDDDYINGTYSPSGTGLAKSLAANNEKYGLAYMNPNDNSGGVSSADKYAANAQGGQVSRNQYFDMLGVAADDPRRSASYGSMGQVPATSPSQQQPIYSSAGNAGPTAAATQGKPTLPAPIFSSSAPATASTQGQQSQGGSNVRTAVSRAKTGPAFTSSKPTIRTA